MAYLRNSLGKIYAAANDMCQALMMWVNIYHAERTLR